MGLPSAPPPKAAAHAKRPPAKKAPAPAPAPAAAPVAAAPPPRRVPLPGVTVPPVPQYARGEEVDVEAIVGGLDFGGNDEDVDVELTDADMNDPELLVCLLCVFWSVWERMVVTQCTFTN